MILLTGSHGFIGSHLKKALGECYEINFGYRNLEIVPWPKITKIYHFGAISSTTETDIRLIYECNINFSIKLFEKAIEYGIPVVYASSASVYGNFAPTINPLNYYAMSKATVDYFVLDNLDKFSNIVGMRLFNVYGKGEEHKGNQASPIHKFIKQAKETGIIEIFENSFVVCRDFICVEDVVKCALIKKNSGIYDVGTGVSTSFYDVAKIIQDEYGAQIKTIPFPDSLKGKYQYYTRAPSQFRDYKIQFKTIKEWVAIRNNF